MAKKKPGAKKNTPAESQETLATDNAVVVDSQSEQTAAVVATDTDNAEQKDTNHMQFQKVSTHKNGLTSYSTPGLRGSIYFGKGVFAKDVTPPDTIEVTAEGLVQPTAEQIERANKRAERKTRVKASLAERTAKAQAKAEKAAANLAKLQARLAKQAPAAGATDAPATGNDPSFDTPTVAATE